MNNFAQT